MRYCLFLSLCFFCTTYAFGQAQNDPALARLDSLSRAGNPQAAMVIALQLRDSAIQKYTKISLKTALAERRIGYLLGTMGKMKAADSVFVYAINICKKSESEGGVEFAEILNSRASLFMKQSKYNEALEIFKQVEAIRLNKLGEQNILTLGVRNNLGLAYMYLGKLTEAGQIFSTCISVCEKNGLKSHSYYPNFLSSMAAIMNWKGRHQQSIQLHIKEIEWRKAQVGEQHPEYIKAVDNLVNTLNDAGQIEAVDSLLRVQIGFWKSIPDTFEIAKALRYLGAIQLQLGLLKEAKENIFLSRDLILKYGDNESEIPFALATIGDLYQIENNFTEAYQYYSSAGNILKNTNLPQYGTVLIRKLEILLAQKRNAEAIQLVDSIGVLAKQIELEASEKTDFLEMKARLAKNLQNPEQSALLFSQAIESEKNSFANEETIAKLLKGKAVMFASFNKNSEALQTVKELIGVRRSALFAKMALLTDNQRLSVTNALESDFYLFANLMRHAAPTDSNLGTLVNLGLFYKNFLEHTARKAQSYALNSKDSTLLNNYYNWLDLLDQLNYAYQLSNAEALAENIDMKALETETGMLEKTLAKRGVPIVRQEKDIEWASIRDALRPDEAAIDVRRIQVFANGLYSDNAMYVFSIIKSGAVQPELVFLENGNDLESFLIGQYQNEISRKKDLSPILFEKFWAPVAAHLKGIKTVYFAPDGVFYKINLNALRVADGTYLLNNLQVKQVTNLRHVLEPSTQSSGTEPGFAALFGNPAFKIGVGSGLIDSTSGNSSRTRLYRDIAEDAQGDLHLSPLPGSQREVNAIAKKLKDKNWQTAIFTGEQATEDTLKKLESPKVLHIATHGYFLKDEKRTIASDFVSPQVSKNPALRSMLFFAGAENSIAGEKTGRNDGIHTAFETAVLKLDQTELVVLSACNTGIGKIQNGEGVFGLQRAFRIAGAKSLIMSLWEVEDAATGLLMNSFYENWLSGMSKTEAFHKAQLMLKAKYPQPFYWGSFILVNG